MISLNDVFACFIVVLTHRTAQRSSSPPVGLREASPCEGARKTQAGSHRENDFPPPTLLHPSHSFLPLVLAKLFYHNNRTVRNYGHDATGAHRASAVWVHHVPRPERLLSERSSSLCHPLLITSIPLSCCRPGWGAITRKDNFVLWISGIF